MRGHEIIVASMKQYFFGLKIFRAWQMLNLTTDLRISCGPYHGSMLGKRMKEALREDKAQGLIKIESLDDHPTLSSCVCGPCAPERSEKPGYGHGPAEERIEALRATQGPSTAPQFTVGVVAP